MATQSLRAGRTDEAFNMIQEAAKKHPEWPPARLILARLHFALGQGPLGRRALEQSAVDAPDNPDIVLTFANLNINEGRLHDAQLNCEKALAIAQASPADSDRARNIRREAYAGLATVAENRQQWETAKARLLDWIKESPESGPAHQRLGRALFQLGQKDEALEALKKGAGLDASLDPPAITMAVLSSQSGDLEGATSWFNRAVKDQPNSARPRLAYARWLIDQGKLEEAVPLVDEGARLDPASKDTTRLRAILAWQRRDFTTAEKLLDPLHIEVPTDLGVSNLLALTLMEQEDSAKRARGLALAEVNARQNPQNGEILGSLCRAYYRSGRLEDAERTLNAAIGATGGQVNGDTAFFAARILADRGRVEEARNLLRSIANLPGAFAYRREAQELFQKLAGASGAAKKK
jgi:uncharacterized protein (TIGR02996 family)